MSAQFWPVDVEYDTRRTVYVRAASEERARQLALDPSNWADAEAPVPLLDTLRLGPAA